MHTSRTWNLPPLAVPASTPVGWKLTRGEPLSLLPRQDSVLYILRGRVWATVDGPHAGPANASGDIVLQAGQRLGIRAGRHLVLESLDDVPARFDWAAAPVPQSVAAPSRWKTTVVQPLRDFGHALGLAGAALVRLVLGLVGYGEYLVAGRGRVLHCMEGNPP